MTAQPLGTPQPGASDAELLRAIANGNEAAFEELRGRYGRAVARVHADPVTSERLEKAGISLVTSTPAEFSAFIRSETERWSKVFKDNAGLKLD